MNPQSSVAHYRIASRIGAGGMGEVYRATDTKLGRDVALKILPAEMARDAERLARFRREARAVATLNHPHIVTIFSVEEADSIHFLTMELVEGQSLERLIGESGLLSVGPAVAFHPWRRRNHVLLTGQIGRTRAGRAAVGGTAIRLFVRAVESRRRSL